MGAASQGGAAAVPRAPPPNAAPAHLFEGPAPSSSVVLYGPEVLRAALHSALARAELEDVQLCCDRGAQRAAQRLLRRRRDCSRAARAAPAPPRPQAPAWNGATTTPARA
jgi:hypothetical protein